jgi:dipeptidyl aminopeptidase/acylaminoacyl peptidase
VAPAVRFVRATAALLILAAAFGAGRPSSAAGGTAPGAPPPAAVFGALPANTDVTLSPNGQRLAWVDNTEAKPRVEIFDVDARKTVRLLALPERLKTRRLIWSDDDTLLVTASETATSLAAAHTSDEHFLTIAFDARTGDNRMLPATNGDAQGTWAAMLAGLVSTHAGKPHTVVMSTFNVCRWGENCLLEVDTGTGQPTLLKIGNKFTVDWVLDQHGKPVAREDWEYLRRAYCVYALTANGGIREILRKDDSEKPTLAGILPDDSALVVVAPNGAHQAAWALPLDGSPMKLLAGDADGDVTDTYVDPYTGAIIGVYVESAGMAVRWLDAQAQRRYDAIKHAFPDRQVLINGWSAGGSRTLAKVESPSSPPVYYLIDFKTHHADIAAEEYPALEGAALGQLREITYKARDGTPIPAYLTLPPGRSAGPVPLVVLPHGGPRARDYPDFDWTVQFLATRGYAVLQPQFRGSSGFGEAFERAGYRQWGGLMQDDVSDGVRAMIDQGIADARRVCIVGISYGGYAALAGAAFTPTLYRCAVSINGISDLRAMKQEDAPTQQGWFRYVSPAQSQWKERIGTGSALDAKSPINSVATIAVPVFIAYGTGDGVVANDQSLRMAEALRKAGKEVTLLKLPDEDHWLSRAETRTQLLVSLESFLKAHL